MTLQTPVLEVQDLRTAFVTARGMLQAVDGVSFRLERGQILAIVGESGSGKSVLSRSILGLLPRGAETSATAQVLLNGQDLTRLPERQLRRLRGRRASMIFQDPMTSLNPTLSIGAQIVEVLVFHMGLAKAAARARAAELLRSVGLPEPGLQLDRYPHQLSGGMRQRVAIAIALACEPDLLIADEPTTALDVTVQAEILDLLRREVRERQMSMILITHDMGIVAGHADEVAVMYAGRIVERAPVRPLFAQTRMPYTRALLDSIPQLSAPAHGRLEAIGGRPPDLVEPPPGCSFEPRCRFATARCRADAPPLQGDGVHSFACWHPLR
ncbi:ABC transporter ATP-binding protein [Falsigemmobacter faecalis]|uniref:ABC transporter ATP-binding protein n=1 Tax=Falsigemmobacter faecalis TaxID=2488730 RepID=A0A3P3DFS3_9RHOB|nr:ABC transporter ATP-binding protein [Falsigemmobacter faecalis]RRH72382.1 ABC transporter ATP-binding protein [Falsigemmobacter faecalis]